MKIPENGDVVVKFGSERCPPCKAIKPILKELAAENDGIEFLDIDVDEHRELGAKYGIRSIPTVLFIRNGVVESQLVGMQPKTTIQEHINLLVE